MHFIPGMRMVDYVHVLGLWVHELSGISGSSKTVNLTLYSEIKGFYSFWYIDEVHTEKIILTL